MDQRLAESFAQKFKIAIEHVVREEYELLFLRGLLKSRLVDISQEKLLSYTDRFPPYVQKAVQKLIAEKYT